MLRGASKYIPPPAPLEDALWPDIGEEGLRIKFLPRVLCVICQELRPSLLWWQIQVDNAGEDLMWLPVDVELLQLLNEQGKQT